ncbi:Type 1 glutamine amidotransferase-like domain-containing protein [Amnibacterium endophyticum]|uniref:Type 1 glutamine amidotransferase-like domain-containing protein n=1 Tax=Amnibacterium endophyticum TaxID=2109337 RepID=A0ABW4LHW8_9MICO
MRLYLSSYKLGDHPEALSGMVRGERHGLVIANALDGLDEARRHGDTEREIEELAQLGLVAHDFDLREHDPASIVHDFGEPDFLWVRGGNVFTLRAAMAKSGIDSVIVDGLRRDAFVYSGYSAGGCVLAPSLAGLELVDSVEEAAATYPEITFDGLNILDRPVLPHLSSPDHPETAAVTEEAAHYDRLNQPYWALSDGQALVVDGSTQTVI